MKFSLFQRKNLLKVSLFANVIFLIYFSNKIYNNKEDIAQWIVNALYSAKITDDQLLEFHKTTETIEEGIVGDEKSKKLKLLILGNSLTAGMAATDKDHGYAHLLIKDISSSRNFQVYYKIAFLPDFERNFREFNLQSIESMIDFKPDIVVFQLGENVKSVSDNIRDFIPYYVNLVNKFHFAKKIITTPFFASKEKNEAVLEVGIRTGANVVDLSHLTLLDARNYARSEKSFNNIGEGMHPGNFGMRNIELLILAAIKSNTDSF